MQSQYEHMVQRSTSHVVICGKVPERIASPWKIPLLFNGKALGEELGGGVGTAQKQEVCVYVRGYLFMIMQSWMLLQQPSFGNLSLQYSSLKCCN